MMLRNSLWLVSIFVGVVAMSDLALAQDEKVRPTRAVPPVPSDNACDAFGYEILKTFDRKYKADNLFERPVTKINGLKESGYVTQKGKETLMSVVELYKEMYEKFLAQVEKDRSYTPKASSGGTPIKLAKGKDWAEALIEFVDLVTKFQQNLDSNISAQTNRDNIKKQCEAMDVKQCELPCAVKGVLKKTCSLK